MELETRILDSAPKKRQRLRRFFKSIDRTTSCGLEEGTINSISRKGWVKAHESNHMEGVFRLLFSAKAFELMQENRRAAMDYFTAAKILEERGTFACRVSATHKAIDNFLAEANPDFEKAGKAYLLLSRSQQTRIDKLRSIRDAQASFMCGGEDIELFSEYFDTLKEIGTRTLDSALINYTLHTSLDFETAEKLLSEIMFAEKENDLRLDEIKALAKDERRLYVKTALNLLLTRHFELECRYNKAAVKYSFAGEHISEKLRRIASGLYVKSALNYTRAGEQNLKNAGYALLRSSEFSNFEPLSRGLFKRAEYFFKKVDVPIEKAWHSVKDFG